MCLVVIGNRDAVAFSIKYTQLVFVGKVHELIKPFGVGVPELKIYRQAAHTLNHPRFQVRRIAQLAISTKAGISAAHTIYPVTGAKWLTRAGNALDDDFVNAGFVCRTHGITI